MRARRALLVVAMASLTVPTHAQQRDLVAPERFDHVVGRVGGSAGALFSNLLYESNNRSMRGPFDPRPEAGRDNARRQRAIAARVRGLFVLRDALFSQQDHPIEHRPSALMMPANWVTAAVADTAAGVALRAPMAPPLDDDAAWTAIASAEALFGSFPPSERVFTTARRGRQGVSAEERAQVENARTTVHALARDAAALIDAAPSGPDAVARAGAERIAASDRAYFTPELRRERVIVLGVEHPNEHELRDEGKGVAIWGRDVPDDVLRRVRDAVYARRLLDGDIAIERYDLTRPSDRRRAIEVLTALVPRGSRGHRVYVWVGGSLIEGTETVRDASHLLPTLQRELAAAPIAHDRVVVYNRPAFRLGRRSRAELHAEIARFRAMGLPLGVNANTASLARAFATAP